MPVNSHPKIDLNSVTAVKKALAKKQVQDLGQQLSKTNASWHAKENPQTFLTLEQKKALMGVVQDKEFDKQVKIAAKGGQEAIPVERGLLPSYDPAVDWRTKNGGKVTPVKDQGTCGSCVSFGTVGVMESMAMIECSVTLDLSEADLHFCSSHGENCNGWFPSLALLSVRDRGVTDEAHFPYAAAFTSGSAHCVLSPGRSQHVYKFTSMRWIIFAGWRKDFLSHYGPMIACMTVYDDFFSYGGGVHRHVSGTRAGGHCILVVGYSQAESCWICKNSWGTDWGDQGFFKIAYGECGIDSLFAPFFGVQGMVLP
jgi:C1A family cysteine protease